VYLMVRVRATPASTPGDARERDHGDALAEDRGRPGWHRAGHPPPRARSSATLMTCVFSSQYFSSYTASSRSDVASLCPASITSRYDRAIPGPRARDGVAGAGMRSAGDDRHSRLKRRRNHPSEGEDSPAYRRQDQQAKDIRMRKEISGTAPHGRHRTTGEYS
jgi:hypothetical protein